MLTKTLLYLPLSQNEQGLGLTSPHSANVSLYVKYNSINILKIYFNKSSAFSNH